MEHDENGPVIVDYSRFTASPGLCLFSKFVAYIYLKDCTYCKKKAVILNSCVGLQEGIVADLPMKSSWKQQLGFLPLTNIFCGKTSGWNLWHDNEIHLVGWKIGVFFFFHGSDSIWRFPEMEVPQNGWFMIENPIRMDDLRGIPISGNLHIGTY